MLDTCSGDGAIFAGGSWGSNFGVFLGVFLIVATFIAVAEIRGGGRAFKPLVELYESEPWQDDEALACVLADPSRKGWPEPTRVKAGRAALRVLQKQREARA